ncbi:hypothetical protein XELAEV_18002725mg [Xenopus laevis]|uniref:Uncharacterized protein n=1 Tax=Xenopus laevis TaxID=8355 RepID=A0A974GZ08_XENLA|nr:hypothetical protein XELAEV_18002725mg [Xenopus laevis]
MDYLQSSWIIFNGLSAERAPLPTCCFDCRGRKARRCVSTSNYILNMPWSCPVSSVPLLVRACYSLLML